MSPLQRLRLAFERTYAVYTVTHTTPIPPLQPFLALPIRERLVLLALLDKASPEEIRAALPFVKQTDLRLTSPAMVAAVATLRRALQQPLDYFTNVPEAGDQTVERRLRQILYPSAAVLLFGEIVPLELCCLGLKTRVILYCALVEEMTRPDIQVTLGCTEWAVKQALRGALEALDA